MLNVSTPINDSMDARIGGGFKPLHIELNQIYLNQAHQNQIHLNLTNLNVTQLT